MSGRVRPGRPSAWDDPAEAARRLRMLRAYDAGVRDPELTERFGSLARHPGRVRRQAAERGLLPAGGPR